MGIHDLWLYITAVFLLNITPGPDLALIIARSTGQGARAGILAALGVGIGAFIHIAAAAIGLSALLLTSALAFTLVKAAGGLYLIYLGIRMLRSAGAASPAGRVVAPAPAGRIFVQGVLTNALNPKVALFFLAFLPQFVDSDAPSKPAAFLLLGLVFNLMGTGWNLVVAWGAGRLAATAALGRARVWIERVIGGLFVGLGVRLAAAAR